MRVIASFFACVALVAGFLAAGSATARADTPAAQQIVNNVAFSADDLPTWQANSIAWAAAGQAGKVVVGGSFSQLRPADGASGSAVTRRGLAIMDAATGQPTSCVLDATINGGSASIRAALAAPDGRTVYVGGSFTAIGGVSVTRVAAIDVVNCSVKPLRVSGIASTVWSLALHGNTLYFGGMFNSVGGQERLRYAAVNATTGALLPWKADVTLLNRPTGTLADGWAVAVSPDGSKVALSGEFDLVNGVESHAFAVVDAQTGANVRTYGGGFIHWDSVGKTLTTSGNTLFAGNEGTGGGVFDGRFALDWNSLDQVWRDTCLGATQALLVYGNALYAAHHAHDCNSIGEQGEGRRVYLTAQDPVNRNHFAWFPQLNDGIGEGIGPRALATATGSNGKDYLWVVGEFTRVNNKGQQFLTRFSTDDTGNPPSTVPVAVPMDDGTIQVRIRSVVDNDDGQLTYKVFRNNSTTPIWTGVADSRWWSRPQLTFVDSTVTPGARYSYQVTVSDEANTSARAGSATVTAGGPRESVSAAMLASKPSLYWSYDESSGAWVHDGSGQTERGRNGLAALGATRGVGFASNGMDFDGSTGYIWNDQPEAGPNVYTVSTWFKTTSTSGGKLIGFGDGRPRTDNGNTQFSGNYDRHIYMNNDGRLTYGIWVGYAATITTPKGYNDGQWHQVVGTQGPEGLRLYVDGVQIGGRSESAGQPYRGNWHVGGDSLGGWPEQGSSQYFAGSIDETAVYDRVLSRRQVSDLYAASGGLVDVNAKPTDDYGAAVYDEDPEFYWPFAEANGPTTADASFFGNNDGTVGSQVAMGQPGLVSGATSIRTSGNDQGTVHAPQSGALSSFTVEAWVKTTRGGKIIGFENIPTGNGWSYDKQVYMSDEGKITFGVYTGSVQIVQSGPGFNNDRWHHIVGSQDSTGMKLYVDGVLQGTNPTTTSETGPGYWRIAGGNVGGWPDTPSNFYLDGSLDDVAVYGYALSNEAVREHFALGTNDRQAPTVPSGLTVQQQPTEITLNWTASTDSSGVAGYRVHRSDQSGFTPSESTLIAESTTTTFSEPKPAPGTYYYTVQAVDNAGNVSGPATQVSTTIADISAPTAPQQVQARIDGDRVTVNWDASSDDVAVASYRVFRGATEDFVPGQDTLRGTVTSQTFSEGPVSQGTYFYKVIAVDRTGNTSDPSEASRVSVADSTPPSTPGEPTAQVDGSSVTLAWPASSDNVGVTGYRVYRGATSDFTPGTSTLVTEVETPTATDSGLQSGSYWYRVVAVDAAGNASGASASVRATVADAIAPSTPGALSTTVQGTTVRLTWSASTDNVGVAGYRVHRGTTEDFQVAEGNRIASPTQTSVTDEGRPAGTYWYKVVAVDEAGNVSAPTSAERAVVESAPPVQPVTRTVTPTADTMVAQVNAAANYGTSNQLSARGTTPIQSYLSFELPAAPSGMVLTGATLRVRTSTDTTAASTATHEFRLLNGTWSETTTTWNNRPTSLGASLGTLSGTTALNTAYTANLNASALSSLAGQQVSIAMVSNSDDNVRIHSREVGSASYRPTLTLTYTAR